MYMTIRKKGKEVPAARYSILDLVRLPRPPFYGLLSSISGARCANPLGRRGIVSVHAAARGVHGHLSCAFYVFAVERIQPQLEVDLRAFCSRRTRTTRFHR